MTRCVAATAVLLVAVIAVAGHSGIDYFVSDALYSQGSWPIDHGSGGLRIWLYDGPRIAIGILGLYLGAASLWPSLLGPLPVTPRAARFLFACILTVPLVVGLIKYQSNVVCAGELQRYGGQWPDLSGHFRVGRLLAPAQFGGCWPSGHVSGGFAMLGLAWLGKTRSSRVLLWFSGILVGGLMGAYQVARGAHFVSHIVVSGLIAQLLVCLIASRMLPELPRS